MCFNKLTFSRLNLLNITTTEKFSLSIFAILRRKLNMQVDISEVNPKENIIIKGARLHNLKNINVGDSPE